MTTGPGPGTMPDYWRTPAEGEPMGQFAVETAASYLRDKADYHLDEAARCLHRAAALDPRNIGGQDPWQRYGADETDLDEEIAI